MVERQVQFGEPGQAAAGRQRPHPVVTHLVPRQAKGRDPAEEGGGGEYLNALVAQVKPTQWGDPTPCEEWDVRALVGHVITTMHAYAELLRGASASRIVELRKQQRTIGGDDLLVAVTDAAAQAHAAFAEPGALERTVHHPMGDLPGSQLLRMRLVDNVVHGWDLATALHLPAVIDGGLAEG